MLYMKTEYEKCIAGERLNFPDILGLTPGAVTPFGMLK